jgi:hypothetical protein
MRLVEDEVYIKKNVCKNVFMFNIEINFGQNKKNFICYYHNISSLSLGKKITNTSGF